MAIPPFVPNPLVPLSLSQIAAEFGGSTPHSLSEYFRGGSNVPSTVASSGIPNQGGAVSFNSTTISRTAHGYLAGAAIRFYNIVSSPVELIEGQTYWVKNPSANSFEVTDRDPAGAAGLPCTFNSLDNVIAAAGHGFTNGNRISFSSITTTTTVNRSTTYYVINASSNSFQISLTLNGDAVVHDVDGSGRIIIGSSIDGGTGSGNVLGTDIQFRDFYGKSERVSIPLSITTTVTNYDVYTNRGPNYVAGLSDVTVTVSPDAIVGSTSTATYAMLVPSSFNPADTVTIINNGLIIGEGGNGGRGGRNRNNDGYCQPGFDGGNALYANFPVDVINNGTIAGAGGGGGGGAGSEPDKGPNYGGGGGGGGAGWQPGTGASGGSAPTFPGTPGSPGTTSAGGAGGLGNQGGGKGGPGGGRGASGTGGAPGTGGGGSSLPGSGALAGYYIVGNPFVTWVAAGTRQGRVG